MVLDLLIRAYQAGPWRRTCRCGGPLSCSQRGRQAARRRGSLRALPIVLALLLECNW